LELLLRCASYSYVGVESRAADPSFDQEDVEDPEYTAPDNDCFNGNDDDLGELTFEVGLFFCSVRA
jgi:hypothetical protein